MIDSTNSQEKMLLDLEISKLINRLNELKKVTRKNDIYSKILNLLKLELEKQEKIDSKRYKININRVDEFKKIQERTEMYSKLSIIEKDFLAKYDYNYIEDPYKIFSEEISPNNKFISKWKQIQLKKYNMSTLDFYNNRDWN